MKNQNNRAVLVGGGVALIVIIAFVLGYSLRGLPNTEGPQQASNRGGQVTPGSQDNPLMDDSQMMSMMQGMDHGAMVTSDADFIMGMIPHHEEAIVTSEYMLSRTDDEEFKDFLQNIIVAQTREVEMMKMWHQDWFQQPYEDDGRYILMMPDLEKVEDDEEVRQQYLMGMVMHHMGAIQMASKIKTITQRPEVLEFADEIISAQNNEIKQMRNWMMESNREGNGMMNNMMH